MIKIASRRNATLLLAALVLVAGFAFGQSRWTRIDPQLLLQEAAQKTMAAESFAYRGEIKITVPGGERVLSRIEGVRSGQDFHITGQINATSTEIYQVGETTYLKDPLNSKWNVMPGNNLLKQDYLMVEVNPLATFNFLNLSQVNYQGVEKIGGRKAYVLTCGAEINHQFLNKWFKDFQYKLWVDRGDHRFSRAQVHGIYRDVAQGAVDLQLEFWDFGRQIKIVPPQ